MAELLHENSRRIFLLLEKERRMFYNRFRKPGMFDNSVILNLQYFKRDSYISVICQTSDFAVEGRKADEVAHLASARSQNTETGILGIYKR